MSLNQQEALILESIVVHSGDDLLSKADKLYAPHNPFNNTDEQWIRFYKKTGYCGALTSITNVDENYINQALELACELNITCEASGIASLGLLLQMQNTLDTSKKILIVNTGKSFIKT